MLLPKKQVPVLANLCRNILLFLEPNLVSYDDVLTVKPVDESLKCGHPNESYEVVLSYRAVQFFPGGKFQKMCQIFVWALFKNCTNTCERTENLSDKCYDSIDNCLLV